MLACAVASTAQDALRKQIAAIAAGAHGKVSVACALPGSALNRDLNPHARPPMQSVFKAPLAVTVLHLVERGELSLDQPVRFRASDRSLPHVYSPLQDEYPAGEVDVPLRRLLELAVSDSDNVAADILLRETGGPLAVDAYLRGCGIAGFQLQDDEATLHRDEKLQYRDWFEPAGAVQFLRMLNDQPPISAEHAALVRLDGAVARQPHRRSPSRRDGGSATTRESVIARIARAAYDQAARQYP